MIGNYILVDKKPVLVEDILVWAKSFEERDSRKVKFDSFSGKEKMNVSTIFLGIDHNFETEGDPVLFETMIFGGYYGEYQMRYCTWDESEKGHVEAVKMILEKARHEDDELLIKDIEEKYPELE
jgi:hypothetical protein